MAINSQSQEKSRTVLVVEDDNELRDLLHTQLELEGYNVSTAHNGTVAIAKARNEKPDIILMDVLMPEMDGIEATKILKDYKDTRHIPVIMVTSEDKREDMIKGLEAGAIDYITKPFYLPELKARVKAVLRFKSIYDDLIRVREELVKKEMSATIRDTVNIVNESIDDNAGIIIKESRSLRQHHLLDNASDVIENAATNIKNTITNLRFLDTLTIKIYREISEIVEKIY